MGKGTEVKGERFRTAAVLSTRVEAIGKALVIKAL